MDLALAGQEHQHVAVAGGQALQDRVADGVDVVGGDVLGRPVADLDRVGPAADLDDRRAAEVRGEPLDVDGRAGDDDPQVGPAGQQAAEVAEQEVDVEAALVGLVDDEGVVAPQVAVPLQLGEQDAVGHHLDPVPWRGAVGEPDREADLGAQLDPALLGDPGGQRAGGDAAGLGVADHPGAAPAGCSAILGSWVVLPEPVSPATTTTWCSRRRRGDRLGVGGDRQVLGDLQPHAGHGLQGRSRPALDRCVDRAGDLQAHASKAATPGRRAPTAQAVPRRRPRCPPGPSREPCASPGP